MSDFGSDIFVIALFLALAIILVSINPPDLLELFDIDTTPALLPRR